MWFKLVGILLSVSGGFLYVILGIAWGSQQGHERSQDYNYTFGNLLMLCSTGALSICWVMQKVSLNCSSGSMQTVAWGVTFGLIPLTAVAAPHLSVKAFALSWQQATFVAYAVVFPSTVGSVLQAWAMRQTSPAFVISFDPIGSVITAIVAWAALGEWPSKATLASSPVIMAGLYFLVWARHRELRLDARLPIRASAVPAFGAHSESPQRCAVEDGAAL